MDGPWQLLLWSLHLLARLAQLAEASDLGSEGLGFESLDGYAGGVLGPRGPSSLPSFNGVSPWWANGLPNPVGRVRLLAHQRAGANVGALAKCETVDLAHSPHPCRLAQRQSVRLLSGWFLVRIQG